VILKIARKGPERQRYAMAQAARGRDPLARPVAGAWPMDTRDFAKVPGRLGRALGAIEDGLANVRALLDRLRPSDDEAAEMRRLLAGAIDYSEQLLRSVEERGTCDAGARERPRESGQGAGPRRKARAFATVVGWLDAAQYFVEKTARDVPRLPPDMRPTPGRASQIRRQLLALIGRAGRLIEVIEAGCSRPGP
jgi:hypothetical protein